MIRRPLNFKITTDMYKRFWQLAIELDVSGVKLLALMIDELEAKVRAKIRRGEWSDGE